jgi:acyl-CoA reductase-like NAD-dependent aldehyde dehydrogenase
MTIDRGALIDGAWTDVGDARAVTSPFDGRRVAIGWAPAAAATAAVDAAVGAMRRGLPAHARAGILQRLATLVRERGEDLVRLLALEAGKPVRAGRIEAERAASTLELSAVEARKLTGHTVPMDATPAGAGHLAFTIAVPAGVVAAITPFNFPLNLACHKLGPALAAGCAVVLKPADKAPLAACLLADLALEAGLPPGWLNVLAGEPAELAGAFADDDRVALITFTGSAEVGWRLRARAPRTRVTLELGNVTPVILDETVAPAAVADRLAGSAFGFAGQSCISTQRIYVHESIADELEERLRAAARAVPAGDPLDEATVVGPLITEQAADRVGAVIEQAGRRAERDGLLIAPAVLADVPEGASILTREAFGPVVAVQRYAHFGAALDACNSGRSGLQAGVFTQRLDRAIEAARRLEFAGVTLNEVPTFRADQMPYGGIKDSGNTREGPAYAVREMTEERLIVMGT